MTLDAVMAADGAARERGGRVCAQGRASGRVGDGRTERVLRRRRRSRWRSSPFVVVVSIVVTVHEFGHYLVGRLCGIAARVFSIGFGTTLWTREGQDGTTWRIAAIPLGGYVKFAAPDDAEPAASGCAFDDAPLWARTATVAAGPAFNFVFALAVLAAAAMVQGRTAEPVTVADLKPMPVAGVTLAPGDQIESVAGRALSLGGRAGRTRAPSAARAASRLPRRAGGTDHDRAGALSAAAADRPGCPALGGAEGRIREGRRHHGGGRRSDRVVPAVQGNRRGLRRPHA